MTEADNNKKQSVDPRKNALRENLKKRKKVVRSLSKGESGEFATRKTAIEGDKS